MPFNLAMAQQTLGINLENGQSVMLNAEGAQAFAFGEIAQADFSVFETGTLRITRVIVPLAGAAGLLGGHWFCVCVEPAGVAAGATGRFQWYGDDVKCDIAVNAGLNNPMVATTGRKVSTTSAIGNKYIAYPKETGTGVKRCMFDGLNGFG